MKKRILLAIGLAGAVNAMADDLPVVKESNPTLPSGQRPGTLVINGKSQSVILLNFGSDQIAASAEYGKRLADKEWEHRRMSPYAYDETAFNQHILDVGMQKYHDEWFAGKFAGIAKGAFVQEMRQLRGVK